MDSQKSLGQGIEQIPSLGFSNAYLVEIEPKKSYVLIDTGTSSGAKKIQAYLEKTGRNPKMITEIILTHADADHSGSAAALRRASGAKLAAHEKDAPRISGQIKKLKETHGFGNVLMLIFGSLMKVERVQPDVVLKDGDTVGSLSIVYTPGHTDGSICIYKPGQALFVGDSLRTDGKGAIKMTGNMMNKDSAELARSVEKISKLEFSVMLPGHGTPITDNASAKLKEFVARGFK
jgi:hydroxyacylglutathione hydrolase